MKYLVMECHEGYAVLMREDAVFVKAADLHYEVGQTVTDPVLMKNKTSFVTRNIVMKVAAIAACLTFAVFSGYRFYSRNMTDTIVISTQAAEIEIHVNKSGSVVALTSDSSQGKEIIKQYKDQNIRLKDSADVANELLAIQIKSGYISIGDTIDISVDTENSTDNDSYRSQIENEIAKLDLKLGGAVPEEVPPLPEKEDALTKKHEPDKKPDEGAAPEPPKPVEKDESPAAVTEAPVHEPQAEKPAPPSDPPAQPDVPGEPPAPAAPERPEEHPEPDKPAEPKVPEAPPHKEEVPAPEVKHDDRPDGPIKPAEPPEHIIPAPQ